MRISGMKILTAALAAFCLLEASASDRKREFPLFTYGVEWGYSTHIHTVSERLYYDDGTRIPYSRNEWGYKSHGEVLIHAGINAGRHVNLSLYTGWSGIGEGISAIPLTLRGSVYYGRDTRRARWFNFAEGGTAFVPGQDMPVYSGRIGAGWRASLSRSVKLDFSISYKMTYLRPGIMENGVPIPKEQVLFNHNYFSAICLNIGLTF